MVWRKLFHLSLLTFISITVGCGRDASDTHGCLGGASFCSPAFDEIPQELNSTTQNGSDGEFSCTATPFPSKAEVGEKVRVQIDTYGGTGTKSIPGYITSFASSTSVEGEYASDKAGTIVTRKVVVKDSEGETAECSFSVQVVAATSSTDFACSISVAPASIDPGTIATFTFTASNAPGTVSFSNFKASASWAVPQQYVVATSSKTAVAKVRYSVAGTKASSIVARSGDKIALCQKSVVVGDGGGTEPAPGGTLTACNVHSSPLGYEGSSSLASIAGTITQLRAIPNGGTAPYKLRFLPLNSIDRVVTANPTVAEASPKILVRFGQAGLPLVRLELEDSLGKKVSCQSQHHSLANDRFAVAAGKDESSPVGPTVKVYRGTSASLVQSFNAFESTIKSGVRVAMGDFNKDGINDTLVASRPADGQKVWVYRGVSSNNPSTAAVTLLETTAGFGSGVADFSLAAGDVNRDGAADIILGSGCDAATPHIRILSGADSAVELAKFSVPAVAGGKFGIASLAAGDINADGYLDVVASSCVRGEVLIFSGKSIADNHQASKATDAPSTLRYFIAHSGYQGPMGVAVGDVNRDGTLDVIAGSGNYADPRYWDAAPPAKVFSGQSWAPILSIQPLKNHRGLFQVASADLNGDGFAEILFAGGTVSLTPTVEIHDGRGAVQYGPGIYKGAFNPFSNFRGSLFIGAGGG